MMKIRSLFCSILFLLVSMGGYSQRMLSLQEAIATALQNNYDIQLSKNDSLVAALDYSYRNAVFLPTLNGTAGIIYNNNNQRQEFATAPKREGDVKSNNTSASVNLNWTLFDGLTMFATRKKGLELLQLGSLTVKNQVVNTVADVINTYYNIVRQKQQLKAVEEQISLNEERVRLAQYKLDIGTGARPDLLQSKVDLNAQRSLKLQQVTLIEQLKEELNQAINVTVGTPIEVGDSIPLNTKLVLGDVQVGLASTSPQLLIAQKNIDIARLTLKERRGDLYPTVQFNSAYNFSKTDNDIALNPNLALLSQSRGFNYGFTASIPILNGFNARRLVRQAQLDVSYQQLFYNNSRTIVNLSVVNGFKNYELQKRALALEEENILLARENVDIVFQTYKLGAATLVQLREAQISLSDAQNRLIAARYNTKLAETELLRLKGDLVR